MPHTPIYVDWQHAVQARIRMEFSRPYMVIYQLLTTQGYLYPFKGISFFLDNYTTFLPIFLSVLIPYTILHCYIYSALFFVILPLNLVVNTLALGPIGIQIGILNTVQQCSCINSYIFKNYLIAGKLNKVFDTTLCLSGMDRVVIPGKLKRLVPQTLGTQLLDINPLSIILSISHIIYIVFISLIPILGTIITEYNHILNTGSSSQTRFWQLSRQRPRQQKYYVKEQEGLYLSFGFVCQIMENIPIFGLFFTFTDTIGAAILAKDVAAEANKED